MYAGAAGDIATGGCNAGFVQKMRHDHEKGGRTSLQKLHRRQRSATSAGRFRFRRAPRMRLGMLRIVPAVEIQLLEGKMHKVYSVWFVFLPKQVHISLAPLESQRQVRATGRRQLQLLAQAHEAVGQSARRDRPRLGRREGDVQRWHQEEVVDQQHPPARLQTNQNRVPVSADHTVAQDPELSGHSLAHFEGRDGFYLSQAVGVLSVLYVSVVEEGAHHIPAGESLLFDRQDVPVGFQAGTADRRQECRTAGSG